MSHLGAFEVPMPDNRTDRRSSFVLANVTELAARCSSSWTSGVWHKPCLNISWPQRPVPRCSPDTFAAYLDASLSSPSLFVRRGLWYCCRHDVGDTYDANTNVSTFMLFRSLVSRRPTLFVSLNIAALDSQLQGRTEEVVTVVSFAPACSLDYLGLLFPPLPMIWSHGSSSACNHDPSGRCPRRRLSLNLRGAARDWSNHYGRRCLYRLTRLCPTCCHRLDDVSSSIG